ncbi:MAG: hypothetical protein ABJ056_04175 [Halioglobus sp.]
MLLLITLLITTAFSLSTTNLRAVGNVQSRDEAIAAADTAIEQVIVLNTSTAAFAAARTYTIDMNLGGNIYNVEVPAPVCVRTEQVNIESTSSVTLPGFSAGDAWNTIWEINAIATQPATGVRVSVVQGIKVLLTTVEMNAVCT